MVARSMSEFSFGAANHQSVVRAMQSDLANVSAEGSSAVMVLAVNIVGDRSAHGDEARAGRDRKEPSFRKKYVDDVGEADAAFATQHASGFVETQNAVEAAAVDQLTARVEARVAITAAQGHKGAGSRCSSFENFRQLVVPCGLVDKLVRGLRITSPRENLFGRCGDCGLLARSCGGLTGHVSVPKQVHNITGSWFVTHAYQFMWIMLAAMTTADARATA